MAVTSPDIFEILASHPAMRQGEIQLTMFRRRPWPAAMTVYAYCFTETLRSTGDKLDIVERHGEPTSGLCTVTCAAGTRRLRIAPTIRLASFQSNEEVVRSWLRGAVLKPSSDAP